MLSEQFKPKGEQAMWLVLYNAIKNAEVGTFFSWEKLYGLTGFNIQKERRGLVYQSNKELLKTHLKMLIPVRSKGYKICLPKDQLTHATYRKTRACRQLKKGVMEIEGLNTGSMTPEEKSRTVHLMNHLQLGLRDLRKRNIAAIEKTKETVKLQDNGVEHLDRIMAEIITLKSQIQGNKEIK
jgi:hypothetical protein